MEAAAEKKAAQVSEDFEAKDGTRLHHAALVPEAARAAVAIIHGYGDHGGRYRHVMEALAAAGFAAHAVDYRGHGLAGGRRAFVARFDDYLADLESFLARVQARSPDLPLFVVGHSQGALISSLYATGPGGARIAGLVLSNPYVRLRIVPNAFQLFQANVVGAIIPFLPVKNPITSSMLTRDAKMQQWTDADPLYLHVVTPRWFTESNAARQRLEQEAKLVKVPLLVLVGTADPIAHPDGARLVFETAGSADKRIENYTGMLHEIFNETGREKPIGDMVTWLSEHAGNVRAA